MGVATIAFFLNSYREGSGRGSKVVQCSVLPDLRSRSAADAGGADDRRFRRIVRVQSAGVLHAQLVMGTAKILTRTLAMKLNALQLRRDPMIYWPCRTDDETG